MRNKDKVSIIPTGVLKVRSKKGYKKFLSPIDVSANLNVPLTKMIFDYFNYLKTNEKFQEQEEFFIEGFLTENRVFSDFLPTFVSGSYTWQILVRHKGILISISMTRYISDGRYHQIISMYSDELTFLDSQELLDKLKKQAIANSDLKGSFIFLPYGDLNWEVKELENKTFGEVFLPNTLTEELITFNKVFEKNGKMLRYLMAGNPGTGKTESVLAISNELKKRGVTVIKTMVCEHLKEKIDLAEMLAPSIVILDDIDLSLGSRKSKTFSGVLGLFLDVLDGTDKLSNSVGIIATTNNMDMVDTAAARPGRFDKILCFDSITKDNIRNIIKKSLLKNFGLKNNDKFVTLFTEQNIIDLFYDSKVTGSHVYNSVKMLKTRIDVLNKKNVDSNWVFKEINSELINVEKIKRLDFLDDKFSRASERGVGFNIEEDSSDLPYETEKESEEVAVDYSQRKYRPRR